MAVSSSRGGRTEYVHHQVPKKFKDAETSPERTKIWSDHKMKMEIRKVPVVYYLSRDGRLEHPHFMEVPISSPNEGLYLRDVIDRLNCLRGKGMASMYSWSSKRSYKNGFVWHDLSENDFIYPVHGQEYVLKGSELLHSGSASPKSHETVPSSSEKQQQQQQATSNSSEESEFPLIVRRRNQSWSSVDLHEYKVYKTESTGEHAGKAADASTQTDEKRRRRRAPIREEEREDDELHHKIDEQQQEQQCVNHSTELSRDEISPPPSSSSPETLESLIKADGHRIVRIPRIVGEADVRDQSTANNYPSGRMKASTVLMQLISCGSLSIKDTGDGGGGSSPITGKDVGLSLVSHYKARLPRGAPNQAPPKGVVEGLIENPSFEGIQVEDKEYFSGSLIETQKDQFPALKRSSSCNADRSSKMELKEREIEGVRAKCIPRMPKPSAVRKEGQ